MSLVLMTGSSSSASPCRSVPATEGLDGERHHAHADSPAKDVAKVEAELP